MDLENFKELSKEQYDALDVREQVKYEMNLVAFKKAEQEKALEAAAEKIVAKKLAEELAKVEAANTEAIEAIKAEYANKTDELMTQLNRVKQNEIAERTKGMTEEIIDKFSTPEGEQMLKNFLKGQRQALDMEVEAKAMKALLVPAGGVAPQFAPIVGPGSDDFHARDLIPVYPTISDLITYVQFTIDPDADGIGPVASGEQKPDIGYIGAVKTAAVVKLAGLIDLSDEIMSDLVGFRAWLAYELPKALLDAEDAAIYKGPGGEGNILGLWTQADFQELPLGSVTSSSNNIDKIAASITEVRTRKRGVNGSVVSPIDWMEMYINKDLELAYTYPVVFAPNGTPTILGVPIYWSNVFSTGQGITGDFRYGTAIFQRMAMRVDYSGEHKDNFGKNLVTARIEERIALPIYFPEAFVKLDLGGTT